MHHSKFCIDGIDIHVNHNSDWSGEAVITWRKVEVDGEITITGIPGRLLLELGKEAAKEYWRQRLISLIEQITDEPNKSKMENQESKKCWKCNSDMEREYYTPRYIAPEQAWYWKCKACGSVEDKYGLMKAPGLRDH